MAPLSADTVVWVARLVLGVSFLLSGAGKLPDLPGFIDAAVRYRVGAEHVVRRLARALPFAELSLAAALLVGIMPRLAAVASLALLAVFAYAVITNLRRGRRIPCACGGVGGQEEIGVATVARIAALGLAAVVVVGSRPDFQEIMPPMAFSGLSVALHISMVVSLLALLLLLYPTEVFVREVLRAQHQNRRRVASASRAEGA